MAVDQDHPTPKPSANWAVLVRRYARYRRMPRWGSMLRLPNADGRMSARHLGRMAEEGEAAVERLRLAIKQFKERCGKQWEKSPERLRRNSSALERLSAGARISMKNVRSLWEALVFDRDGYTCRYCGRNAFTFYAQTGKKRSLRLVVDHRTAVGKDRNTFVMDNSVTACWSCNTLKGALPEKIFLQELDTIIESRMRLKGRRAGRRGSVKKRPPS